MRRRACARKRSASKSKCDRGAAPSRCVRAVSSAGRPTITKGLRRFEFVPLWGFMVLLLYRMRRVDCRGCGVKIEQVPWGCGKHQLTSAYMLFLAH